ncbi:MAG TPA: HD domain-containing phosphohydrolase [Mycobacteriales bacterium]|nr:HD domain-containing phosphohydrolase [Mycobacteriales bacterium]
MEDPVGVPASGPSGLRLAEIVGALSLAVDLGLGQPMEHVARSCLIACRLGERMGLDDTERASLYYVAMLGWVGCIADSHQASTWFGDDIAYRAGVYDVDAKPLPFLGYLLRRAGSDGSPARRIGIGAALVATGARSVQESLTAHCQVTADIAGRLGLGPTVCEPLHQIFARWDGRGLPKGLAGERIALPVRLWHVADVAEVHHRRGGVAAAVEVARQRGGSQFDPAVVAEFAGGAEAIFASLPAGSSWDDLVDAEPALRPELTHTELDAALSVFADYADLKSPYLRGHSRGVADLVGAAAKRVGLPPEQVRTARRAALVHDIGRTGIPNTIWDKAEPLTTAERERVRMHSYYTERMLARPARLAEIGAIAALAHERLDGSGYHRGLPAAAIGMPGRLLAAADTYHASLEPRPHRESVPAEQAAHRLRDAARTGLLDPEAVDAVLAVAGHRPTQHPAGPAGLTVRERQVLELLARGASNRQIARRLGITPKTAGNHVERIYAKTGVTTRAAATLFAMRHGLLRTLEPFG